MNKITVSLLIVLQTWTMSALATPVACEDVFSVISGVSSVSAKGAAVIEALNRPEILEPFANPKGAKGSMSSFDSLAKIYTTVTEYAVELQQMGPAQKYEERKQLLRLLAATPKVSALFDVVAQPQQHEYAPAEYDLKRQLISKMISIIKILPPEFRPKVSKLQYDQRRLKLNKDAAAFMTEQERRFDKLFETTGFKNYQDYEHNLRSSTDPLVQKALALIDQDKIQFVMRRTENSRFWIPKTGFQNQYVSGSSSKGINDKEGRHNVEATMTARTKEEYWNLDDELKPKYGTLSLAEGTDVRGETYTSDVYGHDIYTFKKTAIANRLSFSPGDSLTNLETLKFERRNGVASPPAWNWMFIPWSRRLLMVPFMVSDLARNEFTVPKFDNQRIPIKGWNNGYLDYWETQIFGHIDLDMVETFQFEVTPPAGEFLNELRKRNIKILDARGDFGQAKEWVP